MVTNYPQRLTVTRSVEETDREERTRQGAFAWIFSRLSQALCAMHGHDQVLHFQENRLQLRCTSCGYESPGWEIGQRPPRLRFHGDARRHLMLKQGNQVRQVAKVRRTA